METAISGIVVAGITASLLLAVRYSQMVSEGKAVGQQMMTISEGANRYMKQYSQEILGLDARCAESTLQIDEGNNRPSTPPGTGPDCRLVLGNVTVANGFQPTVNELQDLALVRASDALMLPFSPGIAVDRRTGEAAMARIAVAIRPVRHQQAGDDPSSVGGTGGGSTGDTGGTGAPAGFVPGINHSLGGDIYSFGNFDYKVGTDADRDLPPTINGVNCYNGSVAPSNIILANERIIVDATDDRKVMPFYTPAAITDALDRPDLYKSLRNGRTYCRYLQQRYGMGLIGNSGSSSGGGATGTGGGTGHAWTLESIIFNTQPYYFGTNDLPLGAAAQMGAALQEAGYAGRMSMLKPISMADSRTLRGLFGHAQSENPILSSDGTRGLPGILAAVNLLADSTAASSGSADIGTGRPTWDAAGNNILNAGLIEGQQVATNSAVIGSEGTTLPTKGRDAVLAVKGNLVMGRSSTLMAAGLEARQLRGESGTFEQGQVKNAFVEALNAPSLRTTPTYTAVGKADSPHNLLIANGTQVRLPRVKLGETCGDYGDIGITRAVSIHVPQTGNVHAMTRFIAYCRPDLSQITSQGGQPVVKGSKWASAEYDALQLKFPQPTYAWIWFDASGADVFNSWAVDQYPLLPDQNLGKEPGMTSGR